MAADRLGKQQVRTEDNDDVKVQVVDGSTLTQKLAVDANGKVSAKVSKDTSDNAAANPIYTQLSDGTNAIGATGNGLDVNIKGVSATAVPVSADGSANTVGNPIFIELSDGTNPLGTVTNPVYATVTESSSGSIRKYDKAAAVAGDGGSANHDYTVTALKTLTLSAITVSAGGASRFDVILDAAGTPETIDTFHVPPSGGTVVKDYTALGITLAAGLVIRITKVNNEKSASATLDLYSTINAREN